MLAKPNGKRKKKCISFTKKSKITKKLLLILLCLPMIGFGQNVYIPDANFKAYLVGEPTINTNGDTEIQVSEATAFNSQINCSTMNISDLTGIEAFTALTSLYCGSNQLTSLDMSSNSELENLNCNENQLTSLVVSQNTNLISLECRYNQLTNLDLSQNSTLIGLNCGENQLTSLDVSNNTALTQIECFLNQLTNLDVGNNTVLVILHCTQNQLTSLDLRNGNNTIHQQGFYSFGNPNLFCIDVDNVSWSTTNWTVSSNNIDPQQYFSNNCSGTAIEEYSTNNELLKVTDLLGRELKGTKNEVLFYIYDDGTVEKRIVIE